MAIQAALGKPALFEAGDNPARSRCKHSVAKNVTAPEAAAATKIAQRLLVTAAALTISCTSEAALVAAAEQKMYNPTYILSDNSMDFDSEKPGGKSPGLMMTGMTAKNFDPARYAGRWFEVASLKRGFAGQGQEDCHCTQGVYRFDEVNRAIQVETFCVHGSPDGYITGIRGKVQCVGDSDLKSVENDLERAEIIKEKCFLRFPTLPFIPKLPYDVIATDYDTYALVSGAKDTSFIQIYSRTPNPGREFIDKYKTYLADFGYDPAKIADTPQDCDTMSMDQLSAMMAAPGMEQIMTNTYDPAILGLNRPVQFNPFVSLFDTLKKLVKLYLS